MNATKLDEDEIYAVDMAALNANLGLRSYSGRGMYGDECFGVVGDLPAFATFLVELAVEYNSVAEQLAQQLRQDSMGRHDIYYFPGISAEGFDTEDDD